MSPRFHETWCKRGGLGSHAPRRAPWSAWVLPTALGSVLGLAAGNVRADEVPNDDVPDDDVPDDDVIVSEYGDPSAPTQQPFTGTSVSGGTLSAWNLSAGDNLVTTADGIPSSHPAIERTDGLVYAGWLVDPPDDDNDNVRDAYFACSKDAGQTFSVGERFGRFTLHDPERTRRNRGFLTITSHKATSSAHYFVSARGGVWHAESLGTDNACELSAPVLIYGSAAVTPAEVYTDNVAAIYTELQAQGSSDYQPALVVAFNEGIAVESTLDDPPPEQVEPASGNTAADTASEGADTTRFQRQLTFLISHDEGSTWDVENFPQYTGSAEDYEGIKLNMRSKNDEEKYLHLGYQQGGNVYIDEGILSPTDLTWHTDDTQLPLVGFAGEGAGVVQFDFKAGLDATVVFLAVMVKGFDDAGVLGSPQYFPNQLRTEAFTVGDFPDADYTLEAPTSVASNVVEFNHYPGWDGITTALDYVGLTSTPESRSDVEAVLLESPTLSGDGQVHLYTSRNNRTMAADLFDPGDVVEFSGRPKAVSFRTYPDCTTGGYVFAYVVDAMVDPTGVTSLAAEVIAGSYCLPAGAL